MKKSVIAVAAVAVMVLVGGSSLYADEPLPPTKATGGGVYQHFVFPTPEAEWYPSDEEVGQFSISINPEKKSPRAVIHVDGPELREFWGGPLVIKDTFDPEDVEFKSFGPDPQPAQIFPFVVQRPKDGAVLYVYIFVHDNATPGFNSEDPLMSDWFYVMIEDENGDGEFFSEFINGRDELFLAGGIVIKGNIMDHRK